MPYPLMGNLSLAERDRRWAAIRAHMAERGVDCLIIRGTSSKWDSGTANVRYVSRIGGNGEEAIAIFPIEGDPIVLVWGSSQFEWWPTAQEWVKDVRLGKPTWGESTAAAVKSLSYERGKIGVVGIGGANEAGKNMSYDIYTSIIANLPDAQLEGASALIEKIRLIKSPEEIALLTKSAELGDIGIKAMLESAKPGVKAYEVYGEIVGAILKAGGESPMFLMYQADAQPRHALRFPTERVLEKGDIILQEIAPKYSGYWTQTMVPVSLGEPEPEYARMAEVIRQAYEEGVKAVRLGLSAADLTDAINRPVLDAGFVWIRPQWEGVGLEQIEEPADRNYPGSERLPGVELEEGMLIGFQPMVATEDRQRGLQVGDTVVVTKDGCERLGKSEMRLYVV